MAGNKDIFEKGLIVIPTEDEKFYDNAVGGLKFYLFANSNDYANTTFSLKYELRLSIYDGLTM